MIVIVISVIMVKVMISLMLSLLVFVVFVLIGVVGLRLKNIGFLFENDCLFISINIFCSY